MNLTGFPPPEPPVKASPWTGDYITALFCLWSCLAGYIYSQNTGKGQVIDLAQFEAVHHLLAGTMVAYYELGRCAAKLDDGTAAVIYMRNVVEDSRIRGSGIQANSSLLLAALLSKQGKLVDAIEALKWALLSSDPKVAVEARYSRATLLARRGNRMAASEFLKLTYQFPRQTIWVDRALARAGELYEKAGRYTTALRIFRKIRQVTLRGATRKMADDAVARLLRKMASHR